MLLWHKGYVEVKRLEKQQVQERHLDLPLSSRKQELKIQCKNALSKQGRKKHFYHQRPEIKAKRNLYKQTLLKENNSYLPVAFLYTLVTFPQLIPFVEPRL